MDQVALIGPLDAGSLKWHIKYSEKNNPLIERTFYIYCGTEEVKKAVSEYEGQERLIFIQEEDILSPDICQNKWIYQQLLKLSVDKLRDSHNLSELFLFTDVDTIPFRTVEDKDLFHEGEPIFYISSEHEAPVLSRTFQAPEKKVRHEQLFVDWHYGMSWTTWDLLGIKPEHRVSAIDACVLWNQRILRKLKRHIEDRFDLPWKEAILNSLMKFFISHRKHFFKEAGFREVSFKSQSTVQRHNTVPLEELIQRGRLGFSEWQLYAHFISFIHQNKKLWLGQMGRHPKPHVGEFNTSVSKAEELKKIIKSGSHPAFIYFYPGIENIDYVLNDYC